MPKSLFCFFIVLIFACKQKDTSAKKGIKSTRIYKKELLVKAQLTPKVIDTIWDVTKGIVDGRKFTLQRSQEIGLCVFDSKNDTVFVDSSYNSGAKFIDFNKDGYQDIWITRSENVPGVRGLLLYDKAVKTFKEVVGFDAFPAPEPIPGTKYYYSYHRSGCADMNWSSDLFYIDNFKPVKIGTINGYECGDDGIKDGVYIYKKRGENETLIRRLPIKTIDNYKEYKWGFIKSYWYRNYKLFK
ncbi:hypothetical protein ACFQZI_10895 [Mucilaginibacter lutimaris]|uniref:VCBS repeat-containing protein n=1 Tax=Mucilaginibacter lutimaris TaxID=931629 RepID=A0ABW2ZGL5_9SPHI